MGMAGEAVQTWQGFIAAHPASDWLAFADKAFSGAAAAPGEATAP